MARLEADSFATDKLSRRSFLHFVRSPSAAFLVACRGDRPLGYVVLLFRRGGRSARLYSIAVAAEEAGQGVGSRLLAAAEDTARGRNAERLHLEVRTDNPVAIRFYRQKGYREVGTREDYYEDGMAALLFSRNLTASRPVTTGSRGLSRAA